MEHLDLYKNAAEKISYCPDTGAFLYKEPPSPSHPFLVGKNAYYLDKKTSTHGYRALTSSYDGEKRHSISTPRLIWYMMTQELPDQLVIPVDNDATNLKWDNLKLGDKRDTARMKPKYSKESGKRLGSSPYLGVSWDKSRSKWAAYITVDQKKISLGRHSKIDDAVKARLDAEARYF